MKLTRYYIRGVGVGLIIAWVTGALAYWKTGNSTGSIIIELTELEFTLSIIFLMISIFMKDKTR
ncbi:MAG: hypothetical protein AMDU4_FER2C00027G0016 [Ferroplasma sp. Type II]|uniref:hypothetical protein n=1 Tax=Ferroplasma sp. Type II TaxID=261388 RepID=UPI00038944B7|nr:hypothetical protein [Ferroplasma sp. Type II]EQB74176.1 MAG: hypothetical protein AMDU4_FER2C00027G0016 [Ferroplasma sp. Type II]